MKGLSPGRMVEVWIPIEGTHGKDLHLVYCHRVTEDKKRFIGSQYGFSKMEAFDIKQINKLFFADENRKVYVEEYSKKTKKENRNGY